MTDFIAIVIGAHGDPRRVELEKDLRDRTTGLNESNERLDLIDQSNADSIPAGAHAVAVVFCRKGTYDSSEVGAIAECRRRDIPIIPVVENLRDFTTVAPKEVADFNGFELDDIADVGELAGLMLESLGLQRSRRKIFLSYARMDSSVVAHQLREAFNARWYSVFLDTISIRPGAMFQAELLQELADSDAVVLLNSPNVKDRPYVQEEIAFADRAGVSGVQVIWPGMSRMRQGTFLFPLPLDARLAEIENGAVKSLTPDGIKDVLRKVADMRTDMQMLREEQLMSPIRAYARKKGWKIVPYLGRHIELHDGQRRILLDMALGVPTSLDLERAFRSGTGRINGRLVYDPLGITNRHADHLDFLGSRLALEFLDPGAALQWTIIP
jgi:TIR domain